MANNARRKPKKFTGPPARHRELTFNTKWLNLVEFRDEKGRPYRRFYKLETLISAVDKLVREQDRFLVPAVQQLLGPGGLNNIIFELYSEDPLRFVFHGRATHATRKRANFRLVVAKNQEEASRRVSVEYKHLAALYPRMGDQMVQPLRSGGIFLPDRYRRQDHHREVSAYVTSCPANFGPLGIHRSHQYMALEPAPHTFSKKETEALKQRMVTAIVAAYNPVTRDGIDTHQLDFTTFHVQRPSRGLPKLKLFNCVHMQTRISTAKLLGFLMTDSWENHGVRASIAPEDPRQLFDAISEAVGRDTARQWIAQYARMAATDKVKAPKDGSVDALAEIAAG